MTTIFKDIQEYEGLYQVGDNGVIYSLPKTWVTGNGGVRKHNGKIVVPVKGRADYIYAGLSKNGIKTNKLIHRLVAIAFIPNPLNLPEVNHLDGDKENCAVSNLEWSTHRDNVIHAHETGLHSTKAAIAKTSISVRDSATGEIYPSLEAASAKLGCSRKHLSNMLYGKYRNNTNLIFNK